MKTFWQLSNYLREDAPPMGGPPMGDPTANGGTMGGPPIGGSPMGGGMGAGALTGSLGGDPMGGMGGGGMGGGMNAPAGTQPVKQLKPASVWDVLNDILNNKPIKLKKDKSSAGHDKADMLQNPQPQQQSQTLDQPQTPQEPSMIQGQPPSPMG